MSEQTIRNVATAPKAGRPQQNTEITFVWDNVTLDQLRDVVEGALAIRLQSGWRRNGIPEQFTCNVQQYMTAPRTRAARGPITPKDALAALGAMDRETVLAALKAAGFLN